MPGFGLTNSNTREDKIFTSGSDKIMDNIISTKLFETDGVSAFKIPPGIPTLSKWNLDNNSIIWTGNLRVIEQELITDGITDAFPLPEDSLFSEGDFLSQSQRIPKPYNGLRLKLELYNTVSIPPNVGSLTTTNKDLVWAEIWYNPAPLNDSDNSFFGINNHDMDQDVSFDSEGDLGENHTSNNCSYAIANNGEETIQTTESSKYYKIIGQIPESGYHPFDPKHLLEELGPVKVLQVALGLKFDESFNAVSFAESLGIYKRRYRNFEDQYNYEFNLLSLENSLKKLSLNDTKSDDDDDDDDDDNDFSNGNYYNNRNMFSYNNVRPSTPSPSSSSTDDDDNDLGTERFKLNFNGEEKAKVSTRPRGQLIDSALDSDNDENDDFGDFVQSA